MNNVTIKVLAGTFLKQHSIQSARLPDSAKVFLGTGTTLDCQTLHPEDEHYLVEFQPGIAPWGNQGYLYEGHVQILQSISHPLVELLLSDQYSALKAEAERLVGGKDNTCTAFASSALRKYGIDVPIRDVEFKGEILNISLITRMLSDWITDNLRVERITDWAELLPGDICFTRDNRQFPGFPAHVYFFIQHCPDDPGGAYIVDNQGQNHLRNLDEMGHPRKTPFRYALRLP